MRGLAHVPTPHGPSAPKHTVAVAPHSGAHFAAHPQQIVFYQTAAPTAGAAPHQQPVYLPQPPTPGPGPGPAPTHGLATYELRTVPGTGGPGGAMSGPTLIAQPSSAGELPPGMQLKQMLMVTVNGRAMLYPVSSAPQALFAAAQTPASGASAPAPAYPAPGGPAVIATPAAAPSPQLRAGPQYV